MTGYRISSPTVASALNPKVSAAHYPALVFLSTGSVHGSEISRRIEHARMPMSKVSRANKRRRRKHAKRRDARIRSVAKACVGDVLANVLARSKRRENGRYPITWSWKLASYCYVCDSPATKIRALRANARNYHYGWLCCSACEPWVLREFRPQYSYATDNCICLDSLEALLTVCREVKFTRRVQNNQSTRTRAERDPLGDLLSCTGARR